MQYSYSRVSLYRDCPYHFKLRYLNKLPEIPDYSANSPLILGHALHKGIEEGNDAMLDDYFNSFPVVTDDQITEAMKLEILLPKVNQFLERFSGCRQIHEYKLLKPNFIGFVDLILVAKDGTCLVLDFKYSNSIDNYMKSEQLHVYKHYLEQDGFNVEKLGFLFIPKIALKKGKNESLYHFRKRLIARVNEAEVIPKNVEFDQSKVDEFFKTIDEIEHAKTYPKNVSGKCFSCAAIESKKKGKWTVLTAPDYLNQIQDKNGEILMALPSVERRDISKVTKRVFWIYGAPFTGKTTFANEFPNPLMLNTDGNIRFVDAPFESIQDKVEVKGRITETKLAWDILDEKISELEKGGNEFKTIVVDLLEDVYQACRFYEYEKLGIEHESDNSFKAWDIVRNTFLQMMKRIVHLSYENIIFISHEDISKDITKKTGDKITAIGPNLQDKAALKVAGMVDIVGRVVVDDDVRKIQFKSKDYVFGGGRLPKLDVTEIDLDVQQLMDVYDNANKKIKKTKPVTTDETIEEPKKRNRRKTAEKSEEESETEVVEAAETKPVEEEKPARRSRRKKAEVEKDPEDDETPPGETDVEEKEELPKRKRRERKTEEPVAAETTTRRRRRRE